MDALIKAGEEKAKEGKPASGKGSRPNSKVKAGRGQKVGCQCRFHVTPWAGELNASRVVSFQPRHINLQGEECHGHTAKASLPPHISPACKAWVMAHFLLNGTSTSDGHVAGLYRQSLQEAHPALAAAEGDFAAPPLKLAAVEDGLGNSTARLRGATSPAKISSRQAPKRQPERVAGASGDTPPPQKPALQLIPNGAARKKMSFLQVLQEGATTRREEEDRAAAAQAEAAEHTIAGRRQPRAAKDGARELSQSYAAAVRGEGRPQPSAAAP